MPAKSSKGSLDRAGRSELHYAVADRKLERVRGLVQQGMDVNLADRNGWTSLHFAAQNNDVETARFLLDSGAAVDPRDCYGNTPLFRAVFNSRGSGDLIALLRHHGADPESKNNSGVSPVGLARTIGNYNIAQFFDDLGEAPERPVTKATGKMMEQPFLEHPNGEHESAVDAIEQTIRKLRELPDPTRSLALCAQGVGASEDNIHSAEVRIWKDTLDAGGPLNVTEILAVAKVSSNRILPKGALYSIAEATPEEVARVLDAIFRHHFNIRPFPEEQDYAVGAEWL